jgi:segregation and condensation protein B
MLYRASRNEAPQASAASKEGRDERMRRVESVIFMAREPLSSRRVCQYANLADATEARTLIRRLNELYDARGRAFRVEEVAGGYQLLTRPQFSRWLRRLGHVPGETRFSNPALETLAVVAYRQPIGRAEIEAIRGVNCGEILRQLIERDLVRITGRSEELGRPYLYGTTKVFLQLFGLKSLDDLPAATLGERRPEGGPKQDKIVEGMFPQKAFARLDRDDEEKPDVSATFVPVLPAEELLNHCLSGVAMSEPRCSDDDDFEEEEVEDDDEDDFDDDDDDEEEEEDEEFEDEEFDEEEDFDDEEDFEDEDFEDEEWEEVEDEEDDEEWDDEEEELDWEDEEDDEEEAEEEEEGDDKWD